MAASKLWCIYLDGSTSAGTWSPKVYALATLPTDGSVNTLNMVENTNTGSASTGSTRANTALYAGVKTILNAMADGL